jgi:hypothetical protein
MNDVRNALLDLFDDLRARRLLPVAVLLIAGLIAVPVLLSKKAEEPAVPTTEPATPTQADEPKGPEALAQVRLDDAAAGTGSSLSAFDADNPFSPPEQVVEAAEAEAAGDTGAPTGELVPGGTTGGTAPTGGETTGGTGDGGDTGDGDGGETKTTEFTYVLDVTFWANGHKREIKGMQKLDVLPGPATPLLIFMGVTDKGGNAVFLVDSTLTAFGEGACQPSDADCAMVSIGPGAEEQFTNDVGDNYKLRIDQIRKVKVEGQSADEGSSAKQGESASAAVGSKGPVRRFVPPVIADLLVESTTDNSTGAGKRR